MTQKFVSFEIAKVLKDAGYPQASEYWYSQDGGICYSLSDLAEIGYISRPSYIDAWLWLWQNKGCAINLQILSYPCVGWGFSIEGVNTSHLKPAAYNTQEEAIVAAINFLIDNNLIN